MEITDNCPLCGEPMQRGNFTIGMNEHHQLVYCHSECPLTQKLIHTLSAVLSDFDDVPDGLLEFGNDFETIFKIAELKRKYIGR